MSCFVVFNRVALLLGFDWISRIPMVFMTTPFSHAYTFEIIKEENLVEILFIAWETIT